MDGVKEKTGVPTAYFPYPREWLDADSENMARSISEWADTEIIKKRLQQREDLEHQLRALEILAVDIGLHGLIWPEEMGGVGIPPSRAASTLVRAYEEIGRADPGIGFISAANMALAAFLVEDESISPELKKEIGAVYCGEGEFKLYSLVLPSLGYVEGVTKPTVCGREVQAVLERRGDRWILKGGRARPLNSGHGARDYAVAASDSEDLYLAFVPAEAGGVIKGEQVKATGLLASRNADIDFEDVEVPAEHVIPIGESGYQRMVLWLDLLCGATAVGSAIDVYGLLADWADSRVIKGKGLLKENPMDAAVLAQVAMDIMNSRLLNHCLAGAVADPEGFGLRDAAGLFCLAESVMLSVTKSCMHAVNRAMEIMGSAGYAKEWDVEKHWRDLRTLQVYLGGRTPAEMDIARYFYGSTEI